MMSNDIQNNSNCGWASSLPSFVETSPVQLRKSLMQFVKNADTSQQGAWANDVPLLQRESGELLKRISAASNMSIVLEYELPRDFRRPDAVFLEEAAVVVVEMKGTSKPQQAHIDQVRAYARDLSLYHAACHGNKVSAILVPTKARLLDVTTQGVRIVSPELLDSALEESDRRRGDQRAVALADFLDESAYAPMPGLIQAARELFRTHDLPFIKRARAKTDPCIRYVSKLAYKAAADKSRHLVLVCGVPGAGKTLVGLRLAYAGFLDDLTIERPGNKRSAPAVFLSGNGPLVEVLRHALSTEDSDARVFVQDVKKYVHAHTLKRDAVPPEHVLVFDEAQRAWDKNQVAAKHSHLRAEDQGKSEPDLFIEFAQRIPQWCIVVGLIGGGQEIHTGEEAGIGQWSDAIRRLPNPSSWTVHAPREAMQYFSAAGLQTKEEPSLSLDTELRFHLLPKVQEFVGALVDRCNVEEAAPLARELITSGYTLLVTRDLEEAKHYMRERYGFDRMKRYGLIASSRDRSLPQFGINNSFQEVKHLKVGPWYNADPSDALSCCQLDRVASEFYAQGLELDCALVAWGTDFMLENGLWTTHRAIQSKVPMHDFDQVRRNAYRVLLTRGRDGTIVFVPPLRELDDTFDFLKATGWLHLAVKALL